MRTNIEIDDELMQQAMAATGAVTKKAAVEKALRLTVRLKAQEGILKWFGKVPWEGDLAVSRDGRFLDWAEDCGQESPASKVQADLVPAP